jgi:hypothetical protein
LNAERRFVMSEKKKPVRYGRLVVVLIAPLLALGIASGVSADRPPYEEEPRAILKELAKVEENNIVAVFNHTDEKFKARSSVDVDVITGPDVVPANVAWSQSTCFQCKSMTVALQLALYEPGATTVSPENAGVALNIECTECFTYARAHQIVLPVENAKTVSRNVDDELEDLERRIDHLLRDVKRGRIATDDAPALINALVDEFKVLGTRIENGEFATGDGRDDDDRDDDDRDDDSGDDD